MTVFTEHIPCRPIFELLLLVFWVLSLTIAVDKITRLPGHHHPLSVWLQKLRPRADDYDCTERQSTLKWYFITVSHVSVHTVVRAMCQVKGGWSISAPRGSTTPEPIHVKFVIFDYVRCPTPHAKYSGRHKWSGVGRWVKLTLPCFLER